MPVSQMGAEGIWMCDPVGVKEISERCEVPSGTVSQWRWRLSPRHPAFPDEDYTVSGKPAWEWSTVEAWLVVTGRRPAAEPPLVIEPADEPVPIPAPEMRSSS